MSKPADDSVHSSAISFSCLLMSTGFLGQHEWLGELLRGSTRLFLEPDGGDRLGVGGDLAGAFCG
jgi:hypothetical protein